MMYFSTFVQVLAFWQATAASPVQARSPYAIKETHDIPRRWRKLDRAPADHVVDLQIGVRQNNFEELERRLLEVSDPNHSEYGRHLNKKDVDALLSPADKTLDLVLEWLGDHGVSVNPSSYSSAKDWITVSLPLSTVERLLDTEYHTFEDTRSGNRILRTSQWSLPLHLHEHIDVIQPTTSFFQTRGHAAISHAETGFASVQAAPADIVFPPPGTTPPPPGSELAKVCNITLATPQCFEVLYKTKGYTAKAACKGNKIGFNNFLGDHPIRSDLAKYLAKYRPDALSVAQSFPQIVIADGPGDLPLSAGDLAAGLGKEANLDVQAITGINPHTPIVSYSTGGNGGFVPSQPGAANETNTNEPFLVWVNWLLGQESIPQVISTSYADVEQSVPRSYAERVCRQFAAVGARGTSLLFGSGDDGVGDFDASNCVSNDGKNTAKFLPFFPASCPYVTAVGATMSFTPEIVAWRPEFTGPDGIHHGNYSSGSGFSDYFARPAYQSSHVPAYISKLAGRYDGLYNKQGRGIPDLSAQGLYFPLFWNGTLGQLSGTSASTPLLAGILALVNDALLAEGKPPLGFLNPWLYARGSQGLTDVVSGVPYGCGVDGFPAVEGWDAVTGLGTPVFPKLVELAGGKL